MGSPVIGQPYPMPNQQYGYAQPMPAPIYVQNTGGVYPTNRGYALHDQVDELNRYQGGRSRGYNSGPDSSLLIATLVSEQDSMYGTNMLENLTPADMDYIQSLMARGTPEHEAYRMAFDRKPHVVLPPKVHGETSADKRALEDAIQLSLTESSRRASRPDVPAGSDRADQEALEKAIQLSLLESQGHSQSRNNASSYGSGYNSAYTTSNNTHHTVHAPAPPPNTYRSDEGSYTGSDFHSEDGYSRTSTASRPYDRQYPYNLSTERPKPVNNMTEEDYAKARLLREAEEIRARAYGGGSGSGGSAVHTAELFPSYPRPYPSHAAHQHQQRDVRGSYDDSRSDDYTVDSRDSRSLDNRSQYSHGQDTRDTRDTRDRDRAYTANHASAAAYTTTTHTTVHRNVPAPYPSAAPAYSAAPYAPAYAAPQPYGAPYGRTVSPPLPYRTEDVDYDSSSDAEGKDDDRSEDQYRRNYAAPPGGKQHSRSSNYTSTRSISVGDDGEYTPRDREAPYKNNAHQANTTSYTTTTNYHTNNTNYHNNNSQQQYRSQSPPSYRSPSPSPGSGGVHLANLAVASDTAHYNNYSTSSATRAQNVTQQVSNRSRAASPVTKGPLARIPSFTSPTNPNSTTASSTAGMGSPEGRSLSRVPSFSAPRVLPPAPVSNSNNSRVGIATSSESSDVNDVIVVNSKVSSGSITARTDRSDATTNNNTAYNTTTATNNTSTTTTTAGNTTSAEGALPQHEWRKTLTRLVSKLTIDSDED